MQYSERQIDQPWTSIRQEIARLIDRNDLALAIYRELSDCIGVLGDLGFVAFKAQWESLHAWQGRRVALSTATLSTVGIARGVDASGALCLEVGGSVQLFSGGELSLRLENDT
jgi:BirA family biotin operon repressor/biotin-[acetyl-CoA-carboxylase] ligase